MRSTEHFKRHLYTVVYVDDEKIAETPIEDPFATIKTVIVLTFWEWLKLFWKRQIEVRSHIRSDGVALGRWFQGADICEKCKHAVIGYPNDGSSAANPGYHHGDERWCEACYYSAPVELGRSFGIPKKIIDESTGPAYGLQKPAAD